ncbi:unnamed protein product [Zymoseptoria tritici ST99CH_3D1]|uniref:Uncharacterized protein n=1 Tax=Zymoseptoria tritici (strain CBS 115943 / IPO323) TaxID=336722 RepID=F9XRF8_ZYMTI|nr:uncharacterized protein MYCGRDRAFT_97809 [Zymoseptoria tritici IPO323]EGP82128.1 hypothetical protein MYCGRDRAFT_97809 [Zymoseptoria tritici IPO323]SMR64920.1 unnamed protein product [Zymoseptoria tritici ST99CH_3D1]
MPDHGHVYYSDELNISDAVFPLQTTQTTRVMHLLEDLHFFKSQKIASNLDSNAHAYFTMNIERIAWLIAQNSFCAEYDSDKHEAELNAHFDAIYHKALHCPLFHPRPETTVQHQSFQPFPPPLPPSPAVDPPYTPPDLKRAQDNDSDTPPQPPPVPKRSCRRIRTDMPYVFDRSDDDVFWRMLNVGDAGNTAEPNEPSIVLPIPNASLATPGFITPVSDAVHDSDSDTIWSPAAIYRANDMLLRALFPEQFTDIPLPPHPSPSPSPNPSTTSLPSIFKVDGSTSPAFPLNQPTSTINAAATDDEEVETEHTSAAPPWDGDWEGDWTSFFEEAFFRV